MKTYNVNLMEKFFGSLDPKDDARPLNEIRAEIIALGGTEAEADEITETIRNLRADA